MLLTLGNVIMRFASVAKVKNLLSQLLARARREKEPIVGNRHGKPYALNQPIMHADLEELEWKQFSKSRLSSAWNGEDYALYDYL